MDYIADKKLEPLPEFYVSSERHGFRFLQGCHWKNEKAYETIKEHNEWKLTQNAGEQARFQ